MVENNQTQQAPATPQMFQLIISGEEAGLILNKLNVASFTGFKEASMATTIFAKIQSAQKVTAGPVRPPGPTIVPPVKPAGPDLTRETKPAFTAPPKVEEKTVDAITEVEDNRPSAPLTSLDSVREGREVLTEDDTTVIPPGDDDSIFSVIDRSTKKSGVNVGESDI